SIGGGTVLSEPDLSDRFKAALLELKAEPHSATGKDSTLEILRSVVEGHRANRVVVANLPAELRAVVSGALQGRSVQFLEDLPSRDVLGACAAAEVGVTWAEYAIAEDGAIVEVAHDDAARLAASLPIVHIVLLPAGRLVRDVGEAMERGRANRAATIEKTGLDLPAFRDRVRLIKETAAQDPSIAEAFAEAVRANGGRVFFAATGRQAVQYVLDVCRANGAEFLVKSKSLTSEEVEMNQGLAAEGIRAIETDLGELLCQVAGEKPSHLVFPAIHMTSDRIARMLSEAYGEPIAPEPSSILSAVRARLRPQFLAAKVGVTGANIGVAETGSIVVETNEGNGRLDLHPLRRLHERVPDLRGYGRPRVRPHLSGSDRDPMDGERPRPRGGLLRPPLRLVRPVPRNLPRRHRHPVDDREGEGPGRR